MNSRLSSMIMMLGWLMGLSGARGQPVVLVPSAKQAQTAVTPTEAAALPAAKAQAVQAVAQLPNPATVVSGVKLTDSATILSGLSNGTVSVIVNLAQPKALATTEFTSKAFLATLQAEVKTMQQVVLDVVPTQEIKVGYRFANIAGFSAEVTAAGLKTLQAHPVVTLIEPVQVLRLHLAQGIPLIHGMTYRSTYNGAGLSIAICDSGIDYNHARLGGGGFPNAKVIGGYDFGDNDSDPIPYGNTDNSYGAHGTACAGIAAGDTGTVGDYIGGVAYNAKLYALKVARGTANSISSEAIVAAWDWCVTHKNDDRNNPIMVISTSLGSGQYSSLCDGSLPSLASAANNAVAAGITLLVSSGNDGYCSAISEPACLSSVISVGAVYDASFGPCYPCIDGTSCAPTKTATSGCSTGYYATDSTAADKVTSYANIASFLNVLAPADKCYTLDISGASGYSSGDYHDSFGGTSAACPYAAGAAACLQSAAKALGGRFLTPQEVKDRLVAYGDNVTDSKVSITKPRVNLERAIQSLNIPVLNLSSTTLTGGNGDQNVDPGECNDLTVVVRNDGYGTASGISATLTTTTQGITVVQPNSTYPDIAASATAANRTAFRISASPAFACGTPVNLTLVLTYAGGANTISVALASPVTGYMVAQATGASIVPGTTDTGNHIDDIVTPISLPFNYLFYDQLFSSASVGPNGNLQFLSASGAWNNTCLPCANFNYAILPFWEDLTTGDTGGGIFTSISGSAPNRIFNIEWRAAYLSGGASLNFEVRLYENQARFDIIYGTLNGNGGAATVGAQKGTGSAVTQFQCKAGGLSAGLQLTFSAPVCPGSGVLYVDRSFQGAVNNGTICAPFRTVTEGYGAAQNNNTIRILSGNYPESILNMNKALLLQAPNGVVNIGAQ